MKLLEEGQFIPNFYKQLNSYLVNLYSRLHLAKQNHGKTTIGKIEYTD
uniref:Uncharacterized protein n=1 Tax=Rhizophora mucronata TaxID=61149 RepID=A0A2P2QRL7_RHIMU